MRNTLILAVRRNCLQVCLLRNLLLLLLGPLDPILRREGVNRRASTLLHRSYLMATNRRMST